MERITVSNLNIDIVRKDIQNIHLAVYPPAGRVRIAAPRDTNEDAIRLFIISKLGWIKRHQRAFQGQPRQSPRQFIHRESHYYRGRRYMLHVTEERGPARIELRGKSKLCLRVPPGTLVEKRKSLMDEWYRSELKKAIPELIAKWEKIMGIEVAAWQVKKMKTKWGSCNIEARRIWLNLELAKKPDACLEYIVVHEMVHLLERHHNERFLAYMNHYLPAWRQLKKQLNTLPVAHADWDY